jgi:hypothetical protein
MHLVPTQAERLGHRAAKPLPAPYEATCPHCGGVLGRVSMRRAIAGKCAFSNSSGPTDWNGTAMPTSTARTS